MLVRNYVGVVNSDRDVDKKRRKARKATPQNGERIGNGAKDIGSGTHRKIFLYPEDWIVPELRLPARFRGSLGEMVAFICGQCGAETKRKTISRPACRKGVRALFTGKDRIGALVAAQILTRDLGKNLYCVDLGAVFSKYIGETEKNLRRVFDAAKKSGAVLFFRRSGMPSLASGLR